jgi:Flp pilus assembly CpaE family ATPase
VLFPYGFSLEQGISRGLVGFSSEDGTIRPAGESSEKADGITRRRAIVNSGVSSNLDSKLPGSVENDMSIALVGPDGVRRLAVVTALADLGQTGLHEYNSYPAGHGDLATLLEQGFDIIIFDLDSDPDLALQSVEMVVAEGSTLVMVYSERADQELVLRCMHSGAREYLLLPLDPGILSRAISRAANLRQPRTRNTKKLGRSHVFLGAKGGSGVTTICCNLAIVLAQETDQSTLLIDLALPIGDAALSLGLTAEHSTDDALRHADRLDSSFLSKLLIKHRSGAFLLAAPNKVPDAEASKEAVEKLVAVARRDFDHVIIDVGSRIDLFGTAVFKDASMVYMVTQSGISELRNANRLISQFFAGGSPKLEVIVNRFESRLLGGLNEDLISKALGRPVRWTIPDDQDGARRLQYSDDAATETHISRISTEMACSITGRPVRQEKKKAFGLKRFGRSEKSSTPDEISGLTIAPSGGARVEPTVSWPAPDAITYGEALTIAQLNATASVPGSLVYTPGPGYVLPVGTHTLWVTLTPADSADSGPVQTAVTIVVSKAKPVISWSGPLTLVYGNPLSAAHLNASASVRGRFEYSPGAGEVLPAGAHTISATFTPEDQASYSTEHCTLAVTVAKATPAIEWTPPAPMTCETRLGPAQLNASAAVPGEFEYSPGVGNSLPPGTHKISVTFTPSDLLNYTVSRATVCLTVTKAIPRVNWSTPDPLTYGTLLSGKQLCATSAIAGSFRYSPGTGALLAVGDHTVSAVFIPDDTSQYSEVQAEVPLTVVKATPQLTWPKPEPIASGSSLADLQLNAAAPVAGSFAYTPSAGQVLRPGVHTLSVVFTPTDTLNYATAQAVVPLTVTEKSPVTITWASPAVISYGTPLSAMHLNAVASVEGTFAYAPAEGHILARGSYVLAAYFTPSDSQKYASGKATVPLRVEAPPRLAPSSMQGSAPASMPPGSSRENAMAPPAPPPATRENTPAANEQREIRVYKGATYEKGEDGQWHLQQK